MRKKINFFISKEQDERLKLAIEKTGMTVSELFRRSLKYFLNKEVFKDDK